MSGKEKKTTGDPTTLPASQSQGGTISGSTRWRKSQPSLHRYDGNEPRNDIPEDWQKERERDEGKSVLNFAWMTTTENSRRMEKVESLAGWSPPLSLLLVCPLRRGSKVPKRGKIRPVDVPLPISTSVRAIIGSEQIHYFTVYLYEIYSEIRITEYTITLDSVRVRTNIITKVHAINWHAPKHGAQKCLFQPVLHHFPFLPEPAEKIRSRQQQ